MKITEHIREYIYEEDREFQSGHASTLINLPGGDVLAAWFGGSWEKGSDVAIWMSRRTAQGWQKPYVVASTWGVALWNPVLFRRLDGRILLFYKEGAIIPEWRTFIKYSDDNGETFSEAKELVADDVSGGRGPVKNKPIVLSDGTIAAPASIEGDSDGLNKKGLWDCFVDLSQDGGETWQRSDLVPLRRIGFNMIDRVYDPRHCYGKGIIQPSLWESKPGHLHMLTRSTSSAIFRSDSSDGGKTWCCAYQSGLPNNNSGSDLVQLPDGSLVLAWNPVGNLPNYYKGPRTPLVLSHSTDNGKTWQQIFTLEDTQGGFAYPAIIATEKEILLTYTWNRERIVFWRFKYEG
ncbi:MAG: exo-alpha-sialidase [Defluviitaleaceae bacterium]|nr:exo-alpha-sialidase [Defluviitaleaceae bacterium]